MWGDGGAYGAWAGAMDRWAQGEPVDAFALPPLTRGQFDAGTWARLANRITTALSTRLIAWATATSRSIGQARGEFATAQALTQARAGLRAIRGVASSPLIPDDLRAQLVRLVDDQVRQAQEQLERQVQAAVRDGLDRRYAEQRLRTIRDNALTALLADSASLATVDEWRLDVTSPPRRRVIPG